MASISTLGIGSGIDIEGLIAGVISAEKTPLTTQLDLKEAETTAELTGLGSFKSALSTLETSLATFSDISTFTDRTATSADTGVFTVSADSTAVSGVYDVEVTQLGVSQKLISTGFASASTDVGSGTLTISTDDDSQTFDVTIDSDAQTLADIADAINDDADNFGVTATIITVDDGGGGSESKLVLTADGVGTDNALKIATDDDDETDTDTSGLSQLAYESGGTENMSVLQAAADAIIEVDDQTVTNKSSNVFTDVITGVTITAVSADVGNEHKLTVSLDNASVSSQVSSFVSAVNSTLTTLASLNSFDSATGTIGLLFGDASLRAVNNGVLSILTSTTGQSGTFDSLSQIGVNLGEDGLLAITATELDTALNTSFADIGSIVTSIASDIDDLISEYTLSNTGIIAKKEDGLNELLDDISTERDAIDDDFTKRESLLRSQFIAMDVLLAEFEATSDFLTQQFDLLSNFYKN